ncbi:MAG: GTP 3',8-cyclase MoaA [Bacteroidetes bacterium]|nr:GTP 3',8-cyclase MoaA [Bacteroidota bacterium]
MLTDTFGREHNYLRISLTDVCNFRCLYCMPEDVSFMPSNQLMSHEEIKAIATEYVKLGVTKIRLTGGEPLVRKDADKIILSLSKLPIELTLTSNGFLVDKYIEVFKQAGIRSLNISLDTLDANKFFSITKRDNFQLVWNHIKLLIENGFHVKVNVVAMKGINENEINDFVALTKDLPLHIRFIEFMPFNGNHWQGANVLTYKEILEQVESKFSILKLKDEVHDTAKKFTAYNHVGTFAIISTITEPFCAGCNRMRLTADGKMKNCLFSSSESDILSAYRNGDDILPIIKSNLLSKFKERGGQFDEAYFSMKADEMQNRSMVKIGG